jgi:hypothetical protein
MAYFRFRLGRSDRVSSCTYSKPELVHDFVAAHTVFCLCCKELCCVDYANALWVLQSYRFHNFMCVSGRSPSRVANTWAEQHPSEHLVRAGERPSEHFGRAGVMVYVFLARSKEKMCACGFLLPSAVSRIISPAI